MKTKIYDAIVIGSGQGGTPLAESLNTLFMTLEN